MLISLHAVSIHAPREGCDSEDTFIHIGILRFNSRTPGGVRRLISSSGTPSREFQFTHPGRGATGESKELRERINVSIHAPREGCDCDYQLLSQRYRKFQFTHPGRGATGSDIDALAVTRVSIHAPREGCDSSSVFR